MGNLGLETEDYLPLTNLPLDVADAYAGGKLVSVLEGGYNPQITAECVAAHLRENGRQGRGEGGGGRMNVRR